MTRSMLTALGMLAAGMLAACDRTELSGPPELRVGRDECVACGMLISEDRCSSAMLIVAEGRREHIMFDDIGCMLDYEHEHGGRTPILERFYRDHAARDWTWGDGVTFLFAHPDRLHTPMGSGIVAFGDEASARKAQEEFGGDILDYTRLMAARRAWMEARYGRRSDDTR